MFKYLAVAIVAAWGTFTFSQVGTITECSGKPLSVMTMLCIFILVPTLITIGYVARAEE